MAMVSSGMPRERRSTSPNRLKRSVPTTTVRMPRFSNSTASWILHDVQDPQSARPTITAWTDSTSSSITSSLAGNEAVGLRL